MKAMIIFLVLIAVATGYAQEAGVDTSSVSGNSAPPAQWRNEVYVSAEGNIQGVLSNSSSETNSSTGSLGLFIVKLNGKNEIISEFTAKIAIAPNADTIRTEFGGATLTSQTGATSALVDWRFRLPKYRILPNALFGRNFPEWRIPNFLLKYHVYGIASSGIWASDSLARKTTTYAFGVLLYSDRFSFKSLSNAVNIRFDIGWAVRGILGDISDSNNNDFRIGLLKSSKQTFHGLEVGFSIVVNHVTANFSFLKLYPWKGNDTVDGLTNGQVLAGFTVRGNIMKLIAPID